MFFDRFFNFIFSLVFGRNHTGDMRVRLSSFNRTEDAEKGVFPLEGRMTLHSYFKKYRTLFSTEWFIGWRHCGFAIKSAYEGGGLMIFMGFPPLSVWFTLPWAFRKTLGYSSNKSFIDISIHDWTLWWQFGGSTMEWKREPKWKRGNFSLPDFFLGRTKHSSELLETREVFIPMPEGQYKAIAKKEISTWKRPRWFAKKETYVSLDIPDGIPHQGKGENSWDCGEDSLHGISAKDTYEAAIARAVENVLKSRRKYDGNMNAVYPTPEERSVRLVELRRKNAEESQAVNEENKNPPAQAGAY